ncbi:MAG: TraR/DksA C4-type zinc finger protein [Candidatus Vogelbacteria bacterium]
MEQTLNLEKLKAKLEAEKILLQEELSGIAHKNPKNSKDWEASSAETGEPDFNDETADRIEEFEERQAETDPLEKQLQNIERALAHIADGTYGKCEICQASIEMARLEANPEARTCKKHLDQETAR